MFSSRLGGLAAFFSLALLPALTPAPSSGDDDFVGALFGGLIGSTIGSTIGTSINQQQNSPASVVDPNAPVVDLARPGAQQDMPARAVDPNPSRAASREMQIALNYFDFPAGAPDGISGPKTRAAVSAYQSFMGFLATGRITQFERDILVGAMAAGHSGMPETTFLVATDPLGARALLRRQHEIFTAGTVVPRRSGYPGIPHEVSEAIDEIADSSDSSAEQLMAGSGFMQLADLNGDGIYDYILDTSFARSSFWCSTSQCKVLVFVSTPNGFARNDLLAFSPVPASFQCFGPTCQLVHTSPSQHAAPLPSAALDPEKVTAVQPAMPVFAAAGLADTDSSLSSHCSMIGLLTSERGGFVRAGAGSPDLALSEQFCVARGFAIDLGESRIAGLSGVSPEQVEAQCAAFEPLLAPMVGSLSSVGPQAVLADVAGFLMGSGMSPEQLRLTAEACMSVGYRRDTMDLAVGSVILLVALGQVPYAELIGHHLNEGFGVENSPQLAGDWFGKAIIALDGGTEPVFYMPQDVDRAALLRWAVFDH